MSIFNTPKPEPVGLMEGLQESLTAQQSAEQLDAMTAKTESNSRDFDAQGRPVRSPKGALFAMQVMPATARDPGFGLKPANVSDPEDMNRLGREYRAVMQQRYGGDLAKMWAAYNAGPGAVDSAIKRKGENWLDAMPAETKNYVQKNMTGIGKSSGTAGASMPQNNINVRDVRTVAATAEEKARLNKDREYPVVNPFEVGPKAKEAHGRIDTMTQSILGTLERETALMDSEQEAARKLVEDSNATRGALRDEITTRIDGVIQKAKPIFAKKAEINDRRLEIAEMDPLERMLKGAFNPDYNDSVLNANTQRYNQVLSGIEEEYNFITSLQRAQSQNIDEAQSDSMDLFQLLQTHRLQDLQLMGQSLSMTEQEVANIEGGLRTQDGIERSKQLAMEDTLTNLTIGQLNEAAASENNGITRVNGIDVPVQKINDILDLRQDQEYQLATRQIAIESQQVALAERAEDNLIGSLTETQVREALRNNGTFQGQQLDVRKLADVQAGYMQAREVQTEAQIGESVQRAVPEMIGSFRRSMSDMFGRVKGLVGNNSPETSALGQAITIELRDIANGAAEAKQAGNFESYSNQVAGRVVNLQKQLQSHKESVVKKWAGDNKTLQNLGNAWMSGTPLNSRDSGKAFLQLAKDGLPKGMTLTPAVREMYNLAQDIIRSKTTQQGNDPSTFAGFGSGGKTSAKILDEDVDAFMQEASIVYNGAMTNKAIESLQGLAAEAGHEFGNLPRGKFLTALRVGDQQGFETLSYDMGLDNGQQVREVLASPDSAAWREYSEANPDKDYGALVSKLVGNQTMEMFRILDEDAGEDMEMLPSAALVDFANSPEAMQRLRQILTSQGGSTLGDFLASGVAGGGAFEQYLTYARELPVALSMKNESAKKSTREFIESVKDFNPGSRAKFILGSIPGISEPEEKLLFAEISRKVPGLTGLSIGDPRSSGQSALKKNQMVDSMILNGSFDDPALEKIRKRAASKWQEYSGAIESGASRMRSN